MLFMLPRPDNSVTTSSRVSVVNMLHTAVATDRAEPVPFEISVDPKLIEEAKIKAKLYRPSLSLDDGTNESWLEGPPTENMTALAKY